jgi:ATP-dependent DNA helicase RecG
LPDVEGLSTMQFLEKLRLVESGKIKRSAIVMFGKDPGRFYPGISVRIGRFVNDDADLRFHDVFEGNIVYLLEEVIKQLGYKYLVKQIEFRGILRIEKGEYPLEALREMLLNALVHRTYMGVHVQIRVYNDKIVIWNEGGLPYNMDIEMLKGVYTWYPRNRLIADACFKAGYIDTWGRGTLKIINSCKKAGLPTPEIIETAGGIQVTLFKNSGDEMPDTPQVTTQVKKMLLILDVELNRQEIQEKLGLSDRENFRLNYLQVALDAGLIEMTIPDKPKSSKQKYRLTEKGRQIKESWRK